MESYAAKFKCMVCGAPLSIYDVRDVTKLGIGSPFAFFKNGLSLDMDEWFFIKSRCPKHGAVKDQLPKGEEISWMDDLNKGILRCIKCDKIGTIEKIKVKGKMVLFKIKCPKHGIKGTKKAINSIFGIIKQLNEQGITYKELMKDKIPTQVSPKIAVDTETIAKETLLTFNCPSCDAPLQKKPPCNCDYCGAFIDKV